MLTKKIDSIQMRAEKIRAYHLKKTKEYQARYPDRVKESNRRTKAKYRERNAAYQRIFRSTPEYKKWKRDYMQKYREANREKFSLYQKLYKTRRKGAPGTCSIAEWQIILVEYDYSCWICGKPWQAVDHYQPSSKGGSNWPDNLRPICHSCNSKKRNTWPFDKSMILDVL